MATVLMTGGSGLIGTWVRRRWKETGEPGLAAVDRADADLLTSGVFSDLLDRVNPDVVLHLAWSAGGRVGYRESADNARWVGVSAKVAEHCRRRGIRFIGAGTVLDDSEPSDAYALSKRDLRTALTPWLDDGSTTWLRPYYVVDLDAGRPTVLGAAQSAVAAGQVLALRHPEATHDFVHVSDVASAIVTVILCGLSGVIDIGSGDLRSVAELVTAAGYPWREGDTTGSVLHDQRVADVEALRAAGWAPIETDRFFAR